MGPSGTVQTQVHSNTLKFSNTLKSPAAWGGNGEGCQPHKPLILSGASADICHGFDCFCNAVSLQLFPVGRWVWHAVAPIPLNCTELLSSTSVQQPSSQHQHFSEPANPRALIGQATLSFQQPSNFLAVYIPELPCCQGWQKLMETHSLPLSMVLCHQLTLTCNKDIYVISFLYQQSPFFSLRWCSETLFLAHHVQGTAASMH